MVNFAHFLYRDGQFCDFVFVRHTAHFLLYLVNCLFYVVVKNIALRNPTSMSGRNIG